MGPPQRNSGHNVHNSKEWTCCFGMHVHTATVMIGIWHLFLNILALSLLAVIWHNPHMMEELEHSYDYTVDLNAPALPTPLSKVDAPYAYRDQYRKYQNFDMGGLVCTCMIAITLMMIYGTIKGKPSHLLPFFCLQLFDFAITSLTAAGYLCYLQAIHRVIEESHRLPWREKLLELSPEELVIVVLVVFVFIVFLKAYAIGIVWRCYKYLTLRQQNIRIVLPSLVPYALPHDVEGGQRIGGDRAYSTLLPNYDEAIAQYMKQAPPPSYQIAMSNYQDNNAANGDNNNAATAAIGVDMNALMNDNNNDSSNNNNTVHINANTIRVNEQNANAVASGNTAAGSAVGTDDGVMDVEDIANHENATSNVSPPPYNSAVLMLNGQQPQPQQHSSAHGDAASLDVNPKNESQA